MRRIVFTVVCLLLAAAQTALACVPPEIATAERPEPLDKPTQVTASFIVIDFLGVDDVNQQLDVDLLGRFKWRDPRLIGYAGCRFPVTEIWFPNAILFNSNNLLVARTNAQKQVVIGEGGLVFYENRFTGQVSSYHNLRRFPFDRHDFKIDLGSVNLDTTQLVFVADEANTWITDRLNIEGWNVEGVSLASTPAFVPQANMETSVLTLTISAERDFEFYLYRVILFLFFVVGMSWAIFWVPPSRFEFQIGLGATAMLTSIAFNITVASALPTLGYLTVLDKILIWSIILVAASIVEALVAGRMVMKDREAEALRLDRICRYLFPGLLLGGWALIVFVM